MELLEVFMRGKDEPHKCEDGYLISENFVAVIDGVTSKSDFMHEGKTTGKLAEELVKSAVSELRQNATVQDAVKAINEKLNAFYEHVDFPYDRKQKGLQAVCAIYSDYCREVWLIGDCQVMIDGERFVNPKKSDEVLSEMRSLVLNILFREDPDSVGSPPQKTARSVIEPWILRANCFANTEDSEYGYAVLNGDPIPNGLIRVLKLDENRHEIILASDGYPKLRHDLRASEDYLQKVLSRDPACYKMYRSTKGLAEKQSSFDDRTYIRFLI